MEFLRFMNEGVHVRDLRPLIGLASSCDHEERHRLGLFDVNGLIKDFNGSLFNPVPVGGIRMGRFGIVLSGHVATDVWAVMRNIIWEDEHCLVCCGALMRFVEVFDQRVLLRCGPTIGVSIDELTPELARRIVDEYWTD